MASSTSRTQSKHPAEKKPAHREVSSRTPQQTKLLTLVGLAFLILVLGWVGTMKWNYAAPDSARASSLFERMNGAAVEPGAEKLKEGGSILKSQ